MTRSSVVALPNHRSTGKPGLYFVGAGCSGLTSQGNMAHLSQHQFRCLRRHAARKRQETRTFFLQNQLEQAQRALAEWEAWWHSYKEFYQMDKHFEYHGDTDSGLYQINFNVGQHAKGQDPVLNHCNDNERQQVFSDGGLDEKSRERCNDDEQEGRYDAVYEKCREEPGLYLYLYSDDERDKCNNDPELHFSAEAEKTHERDDSEHDECSRAHVFDDEEQTARNQDPELNLCGDDEHEENTETASEDSDDEDGKPHPADIGMMIVAGMVSKMERVRVAQVISVLEARVSRMTSLDIYIQSREFAMLFEVCGDILKV